MLDRGRVVAFCDETSIAIADKTIFVSDISVGDSCHDTVTRRDYPPRRNTNSYGK